MLIEEVTIKGFKSFGNQIQTIKLNREEGELILIVGSNGNGKSVVLSTEIEVEINLDELSDSEKVIFWETMDTGSDQN